MKHVLNLIDERIYNIEKIIRNRAINQTTLDRLIYRKLGLEDLKLALLSSEYEQKYKQSDLSIVEIIGIFSDNMKTNSSLYRKRYNINHFFEKHAHLVSDQHNMFKFAYEEAQYIGSKII